jgi:hypothetical protein
VSQSRKLMKMAFRDGSGNWWLPIEAALNLANERDDLRRALDGLLPKGAWRDGTMDHMPGVKMARLALNPEARNGGAASGPRNGLFAISKPSNDGSAK